jgi:hypothetical protein
VEGLVRRQRDRLARRSEVDLERVAAEEHAAPGVVQDRVAVEVAAGAVHRQAGGELQDVVRGPGDPERLGPQQVTDADRDDRRVELLLHAPQGAVAVDVAGRQHLQPPAAAQLVQGRLVVPGRALEADQPDVGLEHPAAAVQAEARLAAELRDAGADGRPPGAGDLRVDLVCCGEREAVLGQGVADVGAHRAHAGTDGQRCQWPQLVQAYAGCCGSRSRGRRAAARTS